MNFTPGTKVVVDRQEAVVVAQKDEFGPVQVKFPDGEMQTFQASEVWEKGGVGVQMVTDFKEERSDPSMEVGIDVFK